MNTLMMSPSEIFTSFMLWLLAIPVIMGISLRVPKLVVAGYILVLFLFTSATWGQLQVDTTVYTRGNGMFYFSVLNLVLFIAGAATLLRKLANPYSPHLAVPLSRYFMAFIFLLAAHVVLGLMSGVDILLILGNNGIINVLNMLIFMYLVVMAFTTERDKRHLLLMIFALAGARALFGLARFFLLDGDSANPYRNFESLDIKIVFFDIADNFIASLAAFCAAWILTAPGLRISISKRIGLYLFLGLQVAAVALSFRRSSLLGMALMFLLLLFRLPSRKRLQFVVLAFAIVSAAAVAFFQQRGQHNIDTGSILASLVYDINPEKGIKENRLYELYAAANSIGDNWLFGLGTWGTFTGDQELLSYHFGKFDFVHSGFGHIVMKTGAVGLLLFLAMLWAYSAYYFRHRNMLAGNSRLLADAGFAGFLFWIPTLLIGTPIIEFRTMMLMGLTLAMPFIATGVEFYRSESFRVQEYAAA